MKRNMDLARAILSALEGSSDAFGPKEFVIQGYSEEEVSYHVKLLHQAGLVEAKDISGVNQFKWFPISLTWEGHEFLDAARDNTRWGRAKQIVLEKTGGLSFDMLQSILTKLMTDALS